MRKKKVGAFLRLFLDEKKRSGQKKGVFLLKHVCNYYKKKIEL